MVDTSDEWIMKRVGIRERHIVDAGVATSDLAKEASLWRDSACRPEAGGHRLHRRRHDHARYAVSRARRVWCRRRSAPITPGATTSCAACSGFTYALTTAAHLVAAGGSRHALVVGADVMSSIIDYTDRTTCVLFGDGAGAAVVRRSDDEGIGIIDFETTSTAAEVRRCACPPAGAACLPAAKPVDEPHALREAGWSGRVQVCRRNMEEAAAGFSIATD